MDTAAIEVLRPEDRAEVVIRAVNAHDPPMLQDAANFYVWDSKQAAKEFFTDELLERIAGLYGVRPSIELAEVVTLVENVRP